MRGRTITALVLLGALALTASAGRRKKNKTKPRTDTIAVPTLTPIKNQSSDDVLPAPVTTSSKTPPAALTSEVKTQLYAKAYDAVGKPSPSAPSPTASYSVSTKTPVDGVVSLDTYYASHTQASSGFAIFDPGDKGAVSLAISGARSGQVLLLDCSIFVTGGAATFVVSMGSARERVPLQDGHLLATYVLNADDTTIELAPPKSKPIDWVFWGCTVSLLPGS